MAKERAKAYVLKVVKWAEGDLSPYGAPRSHTAVNHTTSNAPGENWTHDNALYSEDRWQSSFNPVTFTDPREAAQRAKALNVLWKDVGRRVKVVPALGQEPDWRKIEAQKLADGTHKRPLWMDKEWLKKTLEGFGGSYVESWFDRMLADEASNDRFVHVAPDDPTKVEYIRTAAEGLYGRYSRDTTLNYLDHYYGRDLQNSMFWAIAGAVVAEVDDTLDVYFETERDGILDLYQNGPDSCMAHSDESYEAGRNPTYVYATSDFAIAWLGPKDISDEDDRFDRVSARVVTSPDRKVFANSYGDPVLRKALEYRLIGMGYRQSIAFQDWKGVRFLAAPDGPQNRYIFPYLDIRGGGVVLGRDKKHLVYVEDGDRASDGGCLYLSWKQCATEDCEGLISIADHNEYCHECREAKNPGSEAQDQAPISTEQLYSCNCAGCITHVDNIIRRTIKRDVRSVPAVNRGRLYWLSPAEIEQVKRAMGG